MNAIKFQSSCNELIEDMGKPSADQDFVKNEIYVPGMYIS